MKGRLPLYINTLALWDSQNIYLKEVEDSIHLDVFASMQIAVDHEMSVLYLFLEILHHMEEDDASNVPNNRTTKRNSNTESNDEVIKSVAEEDEG
jgi:hypothetical protein